MACQGEHVEVGSRKAMGLGEAAKSNELGVGASGAKKRKVGLGKAWLALCS